MTDILRDHFWACWWLVLIFLLCVYDWIMAALRRRANR